MASDQQSILREIESLLVCLTDTSDSDARKLILHRLMEIIPTGHHPLLYTENITDPFTRVLLRERFSEALNDIKLRYDLQMLIRQAEDDIDLELGAFLISRLDDDKFVTPEDFRHSLDCLIRPLKKKLHWQEIKNPQEILDRFREYLFSELDFKGNTDNYRDPKNSYITSIIETRKGNPVALSVLCLLLGRRINLDLQGINMPGHFILKYADENFSIYLDPFNEGNFLTEQECLKFLSRQGLKPAPGYLSGTSSLSMIKRMYRNLINSYSNSGDSGMEKKLRQHISILEGSSTHFRG